MDVRLLPEETSSTPVPPSGSPTRINITREREASSSSSDGPEGKTKSEGATGTSTSNASGGVVINVAKKRKHSQSPTRGSTKEEKKRAKKSARSSSSSRSTSRDRSSRAGEERCYNCGKSGHFQMDCPKPGRSYESKKCFRCGRKGHTSRFCPDKYLLDDKFLAYPYPVAAAGYPPYPYPPYYYLTDYDRERRERTAIGVPPIPTMIGMDKRCYSCGREGHISKECPEAHSSTRCYNCGEKGHISKECRKEPRPGKCYNCGEEGHIGKDCPRGDSKVCFVCGKATHLSAECPQKPPDVCYNCGEEGHISKDCNRPKNIICHICKEKGHKAIECPANDSHGARFSRELTRSASLGSISSAYVAAGSSGYYPPSPRYRRSPPRIAYPVYDAREDPYGYRQGATLMRTGSLGVSPSSAIANTGAARTAYEYTYDPTLAATVAGGIQQPVIQDPYSYSGRRVDF